MGPGRPDGNGLSSQGNVVPSMRLATVAVPLLLAFALLLPALVDGKPGNGNGNGNGGHGGDGKPEHDDDHDGNDGHDDDHGDQDDQEGDGDDGPAMPRSKVRPPPVLGVDQVVVEAGKGLELRVTLRNSGLGSTQDVHLSTALPDGARWQVKDKACKVEGGMLDCRFGKMAPQAQRTVVATAPAGDLGTYTTVAQAWAPAAV